MDPYYGRKLLVGLFTELEEGHHEFVDGVLREHHVGRADNTGLRLRVERETVGKHQRKAVEGDLLRALGVDINNLGLETDLLKLQA